MEENNLEMSIVNLPDCVAITLLSYLDASSLYRLSRVCRRFEVLIEDEVLWRNIDARRPPHTEQVLEYISERVNGKTRALYTAGCNNQVDIMPINFFRKIAMSKQLTILVLENHFFDGHAVTMNTFPETLVELSLKKSYVIHSNNFFKHSLKTMSNLKVLILDGCNWVESSSLMSISRYEKLEILSLYKCNTVDNSIPYLSLAGSFGFKTLKVIDCRLTELGNALLKSIYKSKSLLAIYLQGDNVADKISELKSRLKGLTDSISIHKFIDESVDDKFYVDDYISADFRRHTDVTNDRGLVEYSRIEGMSVPMGLPTSELYSYPYEECTCSWKRQSSGAGFPNASPKDSDGINDHSEDDDSDDDDSNDYDSVKGTLRKQIKTTIARLEYSAQVFRMPVIIRRSSNRHNRIVDFINGCGGVTLNPVGSFLFSRPQPSARTEHTFNIGSDIAAGLGNMVNKSLASVATGDAPSTSQDPPVGPSEPATSTGGSAEKNTRKRKAEARPVDPKVKKLCAEVSDDSDGECNNIVRRNIDPHNLGDYHVIALVPANPDNIRILNFNNPEPHKKRKIPLRHLSLRGFLGISDVALGYIKNLSLELLDLTGTGVTKDGIDKYIAYNPSCRIIHKDHCVCKPKLSYY